MNSIFSLTNTHQVSAFALHFDIKSNRSRDTSRIPFLILLQYAHSQNLETKTVYQLAADWLTFRFKVTLDIL